MKAIILALVFLCSAAWGSPQTDRPEKRAAPIASTIPTGAVFISNIEGVYIYLWAFESRRYLIFVGRISGYSAGVSTITIVEIKP